MSQNMLLAGMESVPFVGGLVCLSVAWAALLWMALRARRKAREALEKMRHELEERVRERTAELSLTLNELRAEMMDQKRAEADRHLLEEQQRQVKKMESLGVLAGGIAHDFNNILMAILGNLELARTELDPGLPVREYLDDADKAARRAADLSRQMLAYSGRGSFLVQPANLNDLIRELAPVLETSVKKPVELRWSVSSDLPAIEVDASQIRQILLNLTINASEAIGEGGGTIHLTTGVVNCDRERLSRTWFHDNLTEGPYVFLEVMDTGCGMDEHTLERVFDPFFSTKFTGRGLGLPAVLGIVRGHSGTIELQSTPGQGTTVRLLFPAIPAPAVSQDGEPAVPVDWRGRGTVLLVDDEEPVRALGVKMLERLGFRSLTASDGREAVRVFEAYQDEITCVLLDLTMPLMDGHDAFLELRRLKPGIPVMLCSGYTEAEAVGRFEGFTPDAFLQKPYNLGELAARLKPMVTRAAS